MAASEASAVAEVGERRKLFVGGIPTSAHEEELRAHFGRYGEVRGVVVMRDRESGHGRGFAFVEFEEEEAAAKALDDGEKSKHVISGRLVDVKRARARPVRNHGGQPLPLQHLNLSPDQSRQDSATDHPSGNNTDDSSDSVSYGSRKVFIGGLRDNITEEEFRGYFEKFGTVTDVVVIYDSVTNRSRGFGFVTFDSEEAVKKVMKKSFHELKGTQVEAKIAIPKDGHHYRNGRGRGSRIGRGPVVYDGYTYPPYNGRYAMYNGYVPQSLPTHPYFTGFYPHGASGYSYGNAYPNQRGMPNVPSMVPRRGPPVPIYPVMYPLVYHQGYGAGYMGAATSGQYSTNGGSDNKKDHTSVDLQTVDSSDTISSKLESVRLETQ